MKHIFVHIPKTGGQTIVKNLRGMVEEPHRTVIKPSYLMGSGISRAWAHTRWRDLEPSWRTSVPSFAIVRNPWSWAVSQYRFKKKLMRENGDKKSNNGFHIDMTFPDYCGWLNKIKDNGVWMYQNSHRTTQNLSSQKSFLVNEIGIVKVNVLRFEHYDEETMKYLKLREPLKARNVTTTAHHDYTAEYDDASIEWVRNTYKEDIEYFGFDFTSSATKNYYYQENGI